MPASDEPQSSAPSPLPERRVRVLLDRAVSASAGLVALCALGVSLYQAILSRQQQRMSVWPYLLQYNSGRDGGYYRVVQNAGLGPALVGWTEVRVDGTPRRTWGDVVRALTRTNDSTLALLYSSMPPGFVLLPGATHELLEIRPSPFAQALHASIDSGRMTTRVCFCSLYRECWIASSEAREPAPVRACEIDSTRAFRQ
jgi:hypothetical protein